MVWDASEPKGDMLRPGTEQRRLPLLKIGRHAFLQKQHATGGCEQSSLHTLRQGLVRVHRPQESHRSGGGRLSGISRSGGVMKVTALSGGRPSYASTSTSVALCSTCGCWHTLTSASSVQEQIRWSNNNRDVHTIRLYESKKVLNCCYLDLQILQMLAHN
jgi:hypothetical protein